MDASTPSSGSCLEALRKKMGEYPGGPLQAFIVPSEDAHQSEYVADCDLRREYISGFNGSAGLALVTPSNALLWTDGRYFLQASNQLSTDWQLMRIGEDDVVESWLAENLPEGSRVGLDPTCISIDAAKRFDLAFHQAGLVMVLCEQNLIDLIWQERPHQPLGTISVHPLKFSGRPVEEKLAEVREKLVDSQARALIVAALDEVAWLYNIRGSDVAYNPVVRSFAIITLEAAFLYVDSRKVNEEVKAYLDENLIEVRDYELILKDVEALGADALKSSKNGASDNGGGNGSVNGSEASKSIGESVDNRNYVWLDSSSCSLAILKRLSVHIPSDNILLKSSPLALAKALKHPVELEGLRASHIRDGAAMVTFLSWLDEQMQTQLGAKGYFLESTKSKKRKHCKEEEKLTEVSVASKLEQLRSQQEHFVGLSFPTISSVGPNAAIIHYCPKENSCAELEPSLIYLCDSGAQYLDGTTDVTRTVHLGEPTKHQRTCFTRVLQGHIMLDTAVFPNGTNGHLLDILARMPLWREGLDYRHGTGHGVGSYLNVHEGPHLISFRPQARNVAIQANMTVTNEPGYYEEGAFGIRVENVMVVKEAMCPNNFDGKGYLSFEPITWVPIQEKLMDLSIMTSAEKEWVNNYHAKCREKLEFLLSGPELAWLHRATQPLQSV